MTSIVLPAPRREAERSDLLECRLRRYHPRFQGVVRALAIEHAHIADLAVSFPALLFALAIPRPGLDPAPALAHVIAGRPLAETAAAADLPLWLRKLPAESFTGPIPKLPDGALFRRQIANHLPTRALAPLWLQAVAQVADIVDELVAVWIARELIREPKHFKPDRLRLIGLWCWFSSRPGTFGHGLIERPWRPEMRIGPAIEAASTWRELCELHLHLGREPIADMWLNPGRVAGYEFLPLDSVAFLAEEAAAMRNCVRTYGCSLAHNSARLWSVLRNGKRVATLKVACWRGDPLLNITELKGPGNTLASREVWWAARRWLHMHDLPQIEARPRDWRTVTLDRATWLALWRPYWLAKRRVPEWLPIRPSRKALWAL
jgi:hypothetical protein